MYQAYAARAAVLVVVGLGSATSSWRKAVGRYAAIYETHGEQGLRGVDDLGENLRRHRQVAQILEHVGAEEAGLMLYPLGR